MIPPIDIALTINGREVSLDSIPNSVYELLCKFEQRVGVYRIMTFNDGITRKIWWERTWREWSENGYYGCIGEVEDELIAGNLYLY